MRNVTIDTLVVLFVLRAVGELAENVVYFLCGKAVCCNNGMKLL